MSTIRKDRDSIVQALFDIVEHMGASSSRKSRQQKSILGVEWGLKAKFVLQWSPKP